jgi:hypothetical protein
MDDTLATSLSLSLLIWKNKKVTNVNNFTIYNIGVDHFFGVVENKNVPRLELWQNSTFCEKMVFRKEAHLQPLSFVRNRYTFSRHKF